MLVHYTVDENSIAYVHKENHAKKRKRLIFFVFPDDFGLIKQLCYIFYY